MKIELEVSLPEGHEATGEYRVPINETWLTTSGAASNDHTLYPRIILRKIEPVKMMRMMTEGELMRIFTTPYCLIRFMNGPWIESYRNNSDTVANEQNLWEYGFVREDGTVDGPYRFEKECE